MSSGVSQDANERARAIAERQVAQMSRLVDDLLGRGSRDKQREADDRLSTSSRRTILLILWADRSASA